jgi:hypothetical protein
MAQSAQRRHRHRRRLRGGIPCSGGDRRVREVGMSMRQWKTIGEIQSAEQLQKALNKAEAEGWTVFAVLQSMDADWSYFYTVVCHRIPMKELRKVRELASR